MQQIVKGYLSIYRRKIIHRDLKPMNIFLKGKELKIADFGFAALEEVVREPCTYNVGSPLYMPPEALLHNRYSYKSDIWALGVIYYEMLFGRVPWNARTEKLLAQKIEDESIFLLLTQKLTKTSVRFLSWALNPRLEERMSPEDLEKFNFNLDPLQRYSRFKQRLDKDVGGFTGRLEFEKAAWRTRQLHTTLPKQPPSLTNCYMPNHR
jgi:serine/threonine protein kinase